MTLFLPRPDSERAKLQREAAQVFGIAEPVLFNENIAREKRVRDNIFPEKARGSMSHNETLIIQRPILVFGSALLLMRREEQEDLCYPSCCLLDCAPSFLRTLTQPEQSYGILRSKTSCV